MGGFISGSISGGFTTNGQAVLVIQGAIGVGAGIYAGGGSQLGAAVNLPGSGPSFHIEGNAGMGASVGASADFGREGFGAARSHKGPGYGAHAGVGVSDTWTIPLNDGIRCS